MSQYQIKVYKQSFNFSSAHFVVYTSNKRELLHGHNYRVKVVLSADRLVDDMVLDFDHIKPIVKQICIGLDHLILIPKNNPFLHIKDDPCYNQNYLIEFKRVDSFEDADLNGRAEQKALNTAAATANANTKSEFFSIPKRDVCLLPITNITAEKLADFIAEAIGQQLQSNKYDNYPSFKALEVEIEENEGQSATTFLNL